MISDPFEDLSQALRIFLESYWKLGQLLSVARPEAVGAIGKMEAKMG